MNKFIKRIGNDSLGKINLGNQESYEVFGINPIKIGERSITKVGLLREGKYWESFQSCNGSNYQWNLLFLNGWTNITNRNDLIVLREVINLTLKPYTPKVIEVLVESINEDDTNWEEERVSINIRRIKMGDDINSLEELNNLSIEKVVLQLDNSNEDLFDEIKKDFEKIVGVEQSLREEVVVRIEVNNVDDITFEYVEDQKFDLHAHNPTLGSNINIVLARNSDQSTNPNRQFLSQNETQNPTSANSQPSPNVNSNQNPTEKVWKSIKFTTDVGSTRTEYDNQNMPQDSGIRTFSYNLAIKTPFEWEYKKEGKTEKLEIGAVDILVGETKDNEWGELLATNKEITMEASSLSRIVRNENTNKWTLKIGDHRNITINNVSVNINSPNINFPDNKDNSDSSNNQPTQNPPKPNKKDKDKNEDNKNQNSPQNDQETKENINFGEILKPILIISSIFLLVGLIIYSIKKSRN